MADHHTRKSGVCIMSVLRVSDTEILGRDSESSKQQVTFGPGLEDSISIVGEKSGGHLRQKEEWGPSYRGRSEQRALHVANSPAWLE